MDLSAGPRRRQVAVGLCVAALVAVAAVAYRARAADTDKPAAPAIPVTLGTVTRADVPIRLAGTGSVLASQSVLVKVRVDGQLDKVLFTEGQDVKAGQVLALIDPRPLQAALESAQAQKAHDEALLAAAQKDLERYTTLVAQDSIQQQTLDTQKATVGTLKASLMADQAAIDNATVQLGYTTIRSPLNGRTGIRMVDAGNIVHATDTTGLVVVNQIDPIAVLFVLPEGNLREINAAQRASGKTPLVVQAYGREDGTLMGSGHLVLVNNQIDTATGTVQLKALLDNPGHNLWPGQYVNARLLLGTRKDALTVPDNAVQRGQDGLLVWVVGADGTVSAKPVKVAVTQDGISVITDGLEAGQKVVVDGQYKLRAGAKVVASTPAAAPKPAR
jgi:multidrug efflux system membrane fusion protein